MIKLPFSQQEHIQILPLPSPSKTCASLRFCVRERLEKYLLLSAWLRELYGPTRSSAFCYTIDMHKYTWNLLVCNSGQHTYVTGLFNFFFALHNLIDRIDPYFQRIAFRRNLLLILVFSDVNKQLLLEWRCVNWQGEIMAESGQWVSNVKISILLKKGWFSYVRISRKQEG